MCSLRLLWGSKQFSELSVDSCKLGVRTVLSPQGCGEMRLRGCKQVRKSRKGLHQVLDAVLAVKPLALKTDGGGPTPGSLSSLPLASY